MKSSMKQTVSWNRQLVKAIDITVNTNENDLLITPNTQGIGKMYLLGITGDNYAG